MWAPAVSLLQEHHTARLAIKLLYHTASTRDHSKYLQAAAFVVRQHVCFQSTPL
jgi:hypothetical protein